MVDRSVTVRLGLDNSRFDRGLAQAAVAARAFTSELNTSNNRMTALVQGALALGPALVPVGAVAVGAIAGLGEALGAAAAGAVAAGIAFQGVGTAFKALNTFQFAPTTANFQALQKAMEQLGPAGQRFVLFLDQMQPAIQRLRATAQAGLFPGLEAGLTQLRDLAPQVNGLVFSMSSAVGELARQGGKAIDSPFWRDFIAFVSTEGRQSLLQMGQVVGNLTKAAAGLIEAFHPLSADIGAGLVEFSQGLADSAANLGDSQGFQSFIAYIREVGPQVGATLAALGNALIQVTEAASKIGPGSLLIIQGLANAIAAIAASPLGPILLATAAGIAAVSRAMALSRAVSGSALVSLLVGAKDAESGLRSTNALMSQTAARAAGVRTAAAAIGLLALSFTNLDESLGVSNTANFALAGSIFGPWGAGIGALVGLTKDLAAANDDVDASIKNLQQTMGSGSFDTTAWAKAIRKLREEAAAAPTSSEAKGLGFLVGNVPILGGFAQNIVGDKFRGAADEGTAAADAAAAKLSDFRDTLSDIINISRGNTVFQDYTHDFHGLTLAAQNAQPVLDKMGISLQGVVGLRNVSLSAVGDPSLWRGFVERFKATAAAMDSTAGRSHALIGAISELDNAIIPTTTAAQDLSDALDNLLGPGLNLQAATDAYTTSLHGLSDAIDKNNHSLKGNSDAAITNRGAVHDATVSLIDQLKAEGAAGFGTDRLTGSMVKLRDRLIAAGVGAGLARDDMRDLLKTYGLTPHLISTIIKANTNPAERTIEQFVRDMSRKVITINVAAKRGVGGLGSNDPTAQADGSVLRFYGSGGVERHVAQFAPAGAMRVWAEPETGGEAYIPLALSKRPRSRGIAQEVVEGYLGGRVEWFAGGGIRPAPPVVVHAPAAQSGMVEMSGRLTITNWASGEATFRGVARDEYDAQQSYSASSGRQR